MRERSEQLVERVDLAERWLDRARHQLESGDPGRSALTLLLAGAEVARAREESLAASGSRDGMTSHARRSAVPAAAAVVAVAAAAALLLWMPRSHVPVGGVDDAALSIVRLDGRSGSVLQMVATPTAPSQVPEVKIIFRTSLAARVQQSGAAVIPEAAPPAPLAAPAAAGVTAPQALARPALGAAPAPAPVATAPLPASVQAPLLSEADVIDLVLAAERSLRRSANQ